MLLFLNEYKGVGSHGQNVFKYYSKGCIHWRWKYNYSYPPLFEDLIKFIPHFETEFVNPSNVEPYLSSTQLSYVLPMHNHSLLPENIRKGKGAFYTPRPIVHYMCQESLINYLDTELSYTVPKEKIEAKFIKGIIEGEKIISITAKGEKTILSTYWDIKLTGMMGIFTNMIKKHIKSGTEQAMQSIKEEIER